MLTTTQCPVIKYLCKHQAWLKGDASKATHLAMDGAYGGLFRIEPAQEPTFLQLYAKSVHNNAHLFFIEMRTLVFRMFMDLDFKLLGRERFTECELQGLLKLIIKAMQKFYVNTPNISNLFFCVVTSLSTVNEDDDIEDLDQADDILQQMGIGSIEQNQNPKVEDIKIDNNENDGNNDETTEIKQLKASKNGNIHLHFPNLYVNVEQACMMTRFVVLALEERLPKLKCLQNSWKDVLDISVYTKNGLRMAGSHKSGKCTQCKKNIPCGICVNGRVDLGRVYNLKGIFLEYEWNRVAEAKIRSNYISFISCVSIRVIDGRQSNEYFTPPDRCPGVPLEVFQSAEDMKTALLRNMHINATTKFKRLEAASTRTVAQDFQDDTATQKSLTALTIKLDSNDSRYQLCMDIVRKFDSKENYSDVKAQSIMTTSGGLYYRVRLDNGSIGASYCNNIQKSHETNTVYFIIKSKGIYQHCNCRCETLVGRRFGLCKDFISAPKPLLDEEMYELFPFRSNDKKKRRKRKSMRSLTISTSGPKALNTTLIQISNRWSYVLSGKAGENKKKKKKISLHKTNKKNN